MQLQSFLLAGLVARASAHGDHGHSQKPMVDENANWMTKHMAGTSRSSLVDAHLDAYVLSA